MLIQGPDHCSLLHHAAKTGHGEIVKYILEHGESQWAKPPRAVLQPSASQVKPHRVAGSALAHLWSPSAKRPPAARVSRRLGMWEQGQRCLQIKGNRRNENKDGH